MSALPPSLPLPMIDRNLAPTLLQSASWYPVVTLTGPRQSGKTTLCRALFPEHRYLSLEAPDVRAFAREDPCGFLQDAGDAVLLDEVQQVPELLSWVQVAVDEDPTPGRYVLTGSQHLGLSAAVAQTLAGRTAIHHLLPPSWEELQRFEEPPRTLDDVLFAGAYPRIHDRGIPAPRWLSDYLQTWVQRDVRQVLEVTRLEAFERFLRLAAGRTACELNMSALGGDVGVSHNTIREWVSVLETCFLLHRVPPWHANIRKRLIKAPKLHFVDTGLACALLGIQTVDQLRHHPLRGALVETWVASECLKQQVHAGLVPALQHVRAAGGLEVDLLASAGQQLWALEVKSGRTITPEHVRHLESFRDLVSTSNAGFDVRSVLLHGGETRSTIRGCEVIPWSALPELDITKP